LATKSIKDLEDEMKLKSMIGIGLSLVLLASMPIVTSFPGNVNMLCTMPLRSWSGLWPRLPTWPMSVRMISISIAAMWQSAKGDYLTVSRKMTKI